MNRGERPVDAAFAPTASWTMAPTLNVRVSLRNNFIRDTLSEYDVSMHVYHHITPLFMGQTVSCANLRE